MTTRTMLSLIVVATVVAYVADVLATDRRFLGRWWVFGVVAPLWIANCVVWWFVYRASASAPASFETSLSRLTTFSSIVWLACVAGVDLARIGTSLRQFAVIVLLVIAKAIDGWGR